MYCLYKETTNLYYITVIIFIKLFACMILLLLNFLHVFEKELAIIVN